MIGRLIPRIAGGDYRSITDPKKIDPCRFFSEDKCWGKASVGPRQARHWHGCRIRSGKQHCLQLVARAFANATFFFALGQTIGPALAGMIGGRTESFAADSLVAAGLTTVAGLCSLTIPTNPAKDSTK